MVKTEDLTGRTFGRLTVIEQAPDRVVPSGQHKAMWWCKCDCGNPDLKAIDAYSLTHGKTTSCGCVQKETISELFSKQNTFDLSGEYGIGYTSKGEEFYFDLEDYDKIKNITWFLGTGNTYNYVVGKYNGSTILMHRLILECPEGFDIDHIHGRETRNDNRKYNLRIATRSQNNMNKCKAYSNTGIIGVHRLKTNGKFRAYITKDNKMIALGDFSNIEDAIFARKEAEEKYFGEFSYDCSQKIS